MIPRAKITLISLLLAICGSAALVHHYTRQPMEAPTHQVLYSIIYEQMQAMRAQDYGSAYQRVSSKTRDSLPLPAFRAMARTDYVALIGAQGVELGPVEMRGSRALVEVYFIGPRRQVWPCVYILVREGSNWKIERVSMLPRWPEGVRLTGVAT